MGVPFSSLRYFFNHSYLLRANISIREYDVAPHIMAVSIMKSTSLNGYITLLLLRVSSIPSSISSRLNFFMVYLPLGFFFYYTMFLMFVRLHFVYSFFTR